MINWKTQSFSGSVEETLSRVVYAVINETSRCLEEHIVDSAETIDMALTQGMGFPHGGPLRYADSIGTAQIVSALDDFRKIYGERFASSSFLREMAGSNRKFYPD